MRMPWELSTGQEKYVEAARLLTVKSMYRRLVEVMKPQSLRVEPEFRATGAKVGDKVSGVNLEVGVVAIGFVAEVKEAGDVAVERTRGSLGRSERMEVLVDGTVWRRWMVVPSTACWRWILKSGLSEHSRQWKGISSAALMVGSQERKKGPGAQTSEDAK